jgi:hypothetical protein
LSLEVFFKDSKKEKWLIFNTKSAYEFWPVARLLEERRCKARILADSSPKL